VRNFKNSICLSFDKKEALKALSSQQDMMINMLSVSPDDAPVVGNMKAFPNVFLNVGHG
jgi:glycine/D-amino acid oxidase-like deaminating enzyme